LRTRPSAFFAGAGRAGDEDRAGEDDEVGR
jgi:hypothetical protein